MNVKLKICSGCNLPKYIWKSQGKEKFCKGCWYNIQPPKQISPRSQKMQETVDTYTKQRLLFLIANPFCKARLQGCTGHATDVHHLFSGANRQKYFLNMRTWIPICRACHNFIHDKLSQEEAINLGLKSKE